MPRGDVELVPDEERLRNRSRGVLADERQYPSLRPRLPVRPVFPLWTARCPSTVTSYTSCGGTSWSQPRSS